MGTIIRISGKFIKKFVLFAFLIMFLLTLFSYAILQSERGQQWAGGFVAGILESRLQTPVSIASVQIQVTGQIVIREPQVLDHHNEVLFHADSLVLLNPRYFPFSGEWSLTRAKVFKPLVHATQYEGEGRFNYQIIQDKLAGEASGDAVSSRFTIQSLLIGDGTLTHHDRNQDFNPLQLQPHSLLLENLHLDVQRVVLNGNQVSANIEKLALKESSGLTLDHFQGMVTINSNSFSILNFILITPESRVDGRLQTKFPEELSGKMYEEIEWDAHFRHLEISPQDISYLLGRPSRLESPLTLKGKISGTLATLRLHDMMVWFGDDSYITGDYRLTGLPDIENTFLDLQVNSGHLNQEDMQGFFPHFRYMTELQRVGEINMEGRLTGFINDFVAYGAFRTPLGGASTDIHITTEPDPVKMQYSGVIGLNNFDIGRYMELEEYGIRRVSLTSSIEGKGLDVDQLTAELSSKISRIEIDDYSYRDIDLNGKFNQRYFEGGFELNDPNARAKFEGSIDFREAEPYFNFVAGLEDFKLQELNFTEKDLILSTDMRINIRGADPDNINGMIKLHNAKLQAENEVYTFDTFRLESNMMAGQKRLNVYSDMFYADMKGNFTFANLPALLTYSLQEYINPGVLPGERVSVDQIRGENVDLEIRTHNTEFLTRLFLPELKLENNAFFEAVIDGNTPSIVINSHLPGAEYQSFSFEDLIIESSGSGRWLNIITSVHSLSRNNNVLVDNWEARTRAMKDSLHFSAEMLNEAQSNYLKTSGWWHFSDSRAYLEMLETTLEIKGSPWEVTADHIVYHTDSLMQVPQVKLRQGEQVITLSTNLDQNLSQPIDIMLDQVEWGGLHPFLTGFLTQLEGPASGRARVRNLTGIPELEGMLLVEPFYVQGSYQGKAWITASFDTLAQTNWLHGKVIDDAGYETAHVSGSVNFNAPAATNLYIDFDQWPAKHLASSFKGYASQLSGNINGGLRIFGPLNDVNMNGSLAINDGGFLVDYLQTYYTFNHTLYLTDSTIYFDNIAFYDYRDQTARVNGIIRHRMFTNMDFDVRIAGDNFHSLNTTERDNSIYYGRAYATGNVLVSGPATNTQMTIQLRSERNTRLTLPQQGTTGTQSSYSFIRFTQPSDHAGNREPETSYDLTGMNLSMDFQLTPDAEIRLFFDAFGKDMLRGRGQGNIRMNLAPSGSFDIYGDYVINEGEYLFTAADIIRKRFRVEEGGKITWMGDPFDAQIDLTASARQRVSMNELMPATVGDEQQTSTRNVPVLVKAHLTGQLLSPDIRLDLEIEEFPTTTDVTELNLQSAIQAIRSDEQELQQQVISLLVFNRFIPREGAESQDFIYAGVGSGFGELVSAQVSGWLSGISEDLQMGLNYRTADGFNQRELEVTGSTRLFDDRLGIYGAYDFEDASSGDFEVNYRLTEEGSYEVKAFRRNNRIHQLEDGGDEIWGFGMSFSRQFNTFSELLGRKSEPEPFIPEPEDPVRDDPDGDDNNNDEDQEPSGPDKDLFPEIPSLSK